ncbi:MAG: nucleotidyl transferase AbiEii/AbiGii toxin family protein [Candidatus Binatia bacterium]
MHLETLPPPQRAFWDEDAPTLPGGWVLYGGTAIALHLGHRSSRDFDFFSASPLDRGALRQCCRLLAEAKTLRDEPDTLTVVAQKGGEPVKLSFFGGITFGRVGKPIRTAGRPSIASRLDLLGTKLATVTQRIEPRDYLDIAALLGSGLTINDGVAALLALYGNQASGLQSVKTVVWFKDGGLDTVLPTEVKEQLTRAAAQYDPRTPPAPKLSPRLD